MISYDTALIAAASSLVTWYLVYWRKVSAEHWETVESISKSMLLISRSVDLIVKATELQAQAREILEQSTKNLEKISTTK
jgi:hypothetical protein